MGVLFFHLFGVISGMILDHPSEQAMIRPPRTRTRTRTTTIVTIREFMIRVSGWVDLRYLSGTSDSKGDKATTVVERL